MFVAKFNKNKRGVLYIGNMSSKRDWGYAGDYIYGIWKILQHKKPDDFVLATGKSYSVRDFVREAFKIINVDIIFKGKGMKEVGIDKKTGKVHVRVDPVYFRPTDVDELRGDSSKAKRELKWKPKTSFKQLVREMMESDLKEIN